MANNFFASKKIRFCHYFWFIFGCNSVVSLLVNDNVFKFMFTSFSGLNMIKALKIAGNTLAINWVVSDYFSSLNHVNPFKLNINVMINRLSVSFNNTEILKLDLKSYTNQS